MLTPLIRRPRNSATPRCGRPRSTENERGFTMALVAASMVAIIAMAALSIDIGTLYEAKAEAQRAADAAALAAARTISISGITGDPGNLAFSWQPTCGGSNSLATLTAIQVAQQNLIAGVAAQTTNVTVTYGAGPTNAAPNPDCSSQGSNFAVNPIATVKVQSNKLPIFFARVFSLFGSNYSGTTVSATASAEVFNPSASGSVAAAGAVPVNPRCVKPLIIPNGNPNTTVGGFFVNVLDGSIPKSGIYPNGVIGEEFRLAAGCSTGPANCEVGGGLTTNPPTSGSGTTHYIPALVAGNAGAVSSACAATPGFQTAIVGCDQTNYECGTQNGAAADLTENPVNPTGPTGDGATAIECLTNSATGADSLVTPFPFQIQAGLGNPLVQKGIVNNNDIITSSNAISTLPIYDNGGPLVPLAVGPNPQVTIVGFLQVFIEGANIFPDGSVNVRVLNVAGCGNAATNPPANGTSPVPVRLITPP